MDIVYQDNHIIVLVKEPNQPVMEDSSKDFDLLNQVKGYIKEKENKPGNVFIALVHRLDRPVGGLMVFAKTSKAAARLSDSIRKGQMRRKYLAVVEGQIEKDSMVLKDYLLKNHKTNTSFVVKADQEGAKYAELSFDVLATKKNLSLLEVELKTGRHHQIRVQLAHLGHPIFGDMKYGKGPKGNIALFASELGFMHPVTNKYMEFKRFPSFSYMPWPLFR